MVPARLPASKIHVFSGKLGIACFAPDTIVGHNSGGSNMNSTMSFLRRRLSLFLLLFLAGLSVPGPSLRAQKKEIQKEEKQDYYTKWLNEDVLYIITPDEKAVFKKLKTPAEKDHFIEQFWKRRDPDPGTPENEYKEEYYRRIAYANDHFYSGIPGWRTDRGMIYIKFGPPQGIERHPEGGPYSRKGKEGGGFTSTYPFEVWFYDHIDGAGDGIELEFVDPSKTGEYHLTLNPDEKDALLHVPGAGLTDAEAFGSMSRLDRLRLQGLGDPDSGGRLSIDRTFQSLSIRDFPFQRLERLYKLGKAPEIKFKDLEKVVTVRISYDQLPFKMRLDHLQISEDAALVPMTLYFKNADLDYKSISAQTSRATVDVYGRVERIMGQLEYAFEDTIRHDVKGAAKSLPARGISMYQKRLPLHPGRYKLSLVVRDENSGRMSTKEQLLVVPKHAPQVLASSSVILTRKAEPVSSLQNLGDPFVLGKYKVRPTQSDTFTPADHFVQAYFEVYNLKIDESTLKPSARIELSLLYWGTHGKRGEGRVVFPYTAINQEFDYSGDRLIIHKTLPFQGLIPGLYTVRFRVTDLISRNVIDNSVDFSLASPSKDMSVTP